MYYISNADIRKVEIQKVFFVESLECIICRFICLDLHTYFGGDSSG